MPQDRDDIPNVIAPPPLIGLVVLVVGLLLGWLWPLGVLAAVPSTLRIVVGVLLFAIGAWLLYAGQKTFKDAGTNVPPWEPALNLVTAAGPYRWMRNPMYVGGTLVLAGIAIGFASDWLIVLTVIAALIIHYGVVLREERYLEARFGDAYRGYKARVPRYGLPF